MPGENKYIEHSRNACEETKNPFIKNDPIIQIGGYILEAGVRNILIGEIENIKTDEIMAQVTM